MADKKVDMAKQQALEQENIILRKKLADAEKLQSEFQNALGDNVFNEIKKIRQKGKSSATRLTVTEHHDHKNISLWTKYGKRIGPMHPDNAIQTLNRFADFGIMLSADQPTDEQVEAYKQTSEYKAFEIKESKRRAIKQKSRRSGQMERLATEIAKMSGLTVEAINRVLPAAAVGKK